MKIIFMGTPEFSCPTLEKLIADPEFEVVAVYTKEPQISGRGHKIKNSRIHELALKNNIKVITPKTLKTPETQKEFKDLNADAAVVVAYGLILPQEILDGTKLGCVNIHPSALPRWRGAAPIQRTIMSGDKESSVCIIKMDAGVDSGDILMEEKFELYVSDTSKSLTPKLAELGSVLLLKTLKDLRDNNLNPIKQDDNLATYAKKISKEECKINWNKTAKEIEQKIRALNGVLGAYLNYDDEKIKIFAAEVFDEENLENKFQEQKPGTILSEDFLIKCNGGAIKILELQRQGKKPVKIKDFLLGFKVKIDKILQ